MLDEGEVIDSICFMKGSLLSHQGLILAAELAVDGVSADMEVARMHYGNHDGIVLALPDF